MNEIVIVVTGAAPLSPDAVAQLPAGAIVIAVDGALDHALAAGLVPAGVVGDLDSISPAGLAWAESHATISRHDPAKDRTDTELALAMAADLDPARLVLLAGGGDRLDHTMAAIGALGSLEVTSIPAIDGWWGDQRFHVLHGPGSLALDLEAGAVVSLLALHGPARDVTADGLAWPLDHDELTPLSGRGVSNVAAGGRVGLRVGHGVLIAFVHAPDPDHPAAVPARDPSPDPTTQD